MGAPSSWRHVRCRGILHSYMILYVTLVMAFSTILFTTLPKDIGTNEEFRRPQTLVILLTARRELLEPAHKVRLREFPHDRVHTDNHGLEAMVTHSARIHL